MHKKIVFILIVCMVVLSAMIALLFFLRPRLMKQSATDAAYQDAWKLERIQGGWVSAEEGYTLQIDGYDFTLQIDGVFAVIASLQFDAAETPQAGSARFTLRVDPASVILPDAPGAPQYAIDTLAYEDGVLLLRLLDARGEAGEPIRLQQSEAA